MGTHMTDTLPEHTGVGVVSNILKSRFSSVSNSPFFSSSAPFGLGAYCEHQHWDVDLCNVNLL